MLNIVKCPAFYKGTGVYHRENIKLKEQLSSILKESTPRFEVFTLNTTLEGEFKNHLQDLLNRGYELKSCFTGIFEGSNCTEHVWKAILVRDNQRDS